MKTTFESRCGFGPRQYELTIDGPLYKYAQNNAPSGVLPLCNFGGVAVWLVDGCGDECIAAYDFGSGYDHVHRHCIHYSPSGRPFIKKGGARYYFDEMMRAA